MINKRIQKLRMEMARKNISIYIIPTSDYHDSEYVGDYFKAREYMSGFTGSAGTLVVTQQKSGLWTDARYFLQAKNQLAGSEIELYRMGEEGVPTIKEFLEQELCEGENLGYDGRVVTAKQGIEYRTLATAKHGAVITEYDLVAELWEDRPALTTEPIWVYEEAYNGESVESKLAKLRKVMDEKCASVHVLSSLYDIAWLLNLRGWDITYVPVFLSYVVLTQEECILFVREEILTEEVKSYLSEHKVSISSYDSFYDFLSNLPAKEVVMTNLSVVNDRTNDVLKQEHRIIDTPNPSEKLKAIKNETQLKHLRNAHLKDAVAMCKFMYYLKTNIGKIPMSELSVAQVLEEYRKAEEGYLELSFETISGYNEHGAIVHYAVTEETDKALEPHGLLLVDSGAHYMDGTTDITRTFALGPITEEMRTNFTRVCRSNINLASAKFLYGCTGINLDVLAREPLWEAELDYKHGTGHGVGYVLNVHEGPNAFRWKVTPKRGEDSILEEGMITTDEPGLYIENAYGIRTENELICRKGNKNEYGQFMYFENLTYVPIDLDAIDPKQMSAQEKTRLNDYHAMVFEKVSPYLTKEEVEFLREYTRAI